MYLFMENWRATVIPAIVVPVALIGRRLACMRWAIHQHADPVCDGAGDRHRGGRCDCGVENVERIMREEDLPPRAATRKRWGRSSTRSSPSRCAGRGICADGLFQRHRGAISDSLRDAGAHDRVSMLMALTLTPPCAHLLRHTPDMTTGQPPASLAGLIASCAHHPELSVRCVACAEKNRRYMLLYLAILVAVGVLVWKLPTAFCGRRPGLLLSA